MTTSTLDNPDTLERERLAASHDQITSLVRDLPDQHGDHGGNRFYGVARTIRGLFSGNAAVADESSSSVVDSGARVVGSKGRFQRAVHRLRASALYDPTRKSYAPYGFFNGRPIIGETTPIHGGVYVGAFPQEALVIDEKHGHLTNIFHEATAALAQVESQQRATEKEILFAVCALVERRVRFSIDGFEALLEEESLLADNKTSLDLFVQSRVGLARHQVLLAAYLIEKLRARGTLKGCMSLDGNYSDHYAQDDRLLYTSESGSLFVFDPLKTAKERSQAGILLS